MNEQTLTNLYQIMHSFTQLLHEVLTKAASLFLLLFVSYTDTKTKYSIGDHNGGKKLYFDAVIFLQFCNKWWGRSGSGNSGLFTNIYSLFFAKLKLTTAFFKNYDWFCGIDCQL